MQYYDSKGRKVNLLFDKQFTEGSSASIHFLKDREIVLKRYNNNTPSCRKIQVKEFDFFKSIDSESFIRIGEYFCNSKEKSEIAAYTYDYVNDDCINILLSCVEFFVTSIHNLEVLVDIFNENHVLLYDLKVFNTIINKSGIVLLDPDRFRIRNDIDKDTIKYTNRYKLLVLIRSLLFDKLSEHMIGSCGKIEELLPVQLTEEKEITLVVEKRLSLCKKVGDFLQE